MNNKIKTAVHFAEGFEEIEAITIVDILRRADIDCITISVTQRKIVKGSHSVSIICDEIFDDIDYSTIDMIILPGGMPGSKNLDNHIGLKQIIRDFDKKGKYLAAICAAPMVFGNLGLLKEKKAVCYPGFETYLPTSIIQDIPVVQSDRIITAKGPGAAIEFALKLVEIIKGEAVSNGIKKTLMVEGN